MVTRVAILAMMLCGQTGFAAPTWKYVGEFESLLGEEAGPFQSDCPEASSNVQRDWQALYAEITPHIDADKARELSVYALPQMAHYVYHPSPEPTELAVYACNDQSLIYETTLDTLPAHVAIVRRWLKAYLISPRGSDKLLPTEVIFAVRGKVFE